MKISAKDSVYLLEIRLNIPEKAEKRRELKKAGDLPAFFGSSRTLGGRAAWGRA